MGGLPFVGLKLTDRVFGASTFNENSRRRFDGTYIAQRIFYHIVEQAIASGLVGGEVLYTDSTHLKANANKGRDNKEMWPNPMRLPKLKMPTSQNKQNPAKMTGSVSGPKGRTNKVRP